MSKRTPFVGGNWKSNGSKKSVIELVAALNQIKFPKAVEVVVAPTSLHAPYVLEIISADIKVAVQNCSRTKSGAWTGELSPEMIKDFGIPWVILGHSERRQNYHETDQVVADKIALALKEGLKVIACLGETLEERKAGKTMEVVTRQIKAIAGAVNEWSNVVIAYEPVWAIGTGVTATPQQAQEVHAAIRKWLDDNVNHIVASGTRLIYGGSVKADNCVTLMAEKDIDGFLVGGASLVAADFAKIMNSPISKL